MQLDRRQTVAGLGGLLGPLAVLAGEGRAAAPAGATRVILLGTKGGPPLSARSGRANSSTVLLIGEAAYVVDCGYGVSRQLISAGVSLDRIRCIFITHHHSDHNLEYGPLLYNAW